MPVWEKAYNLSTGIPLENPAGNAPLQSDIKNIIHAIMGVVGIVAVIVIVVGGISYIVSNGSSEKVKGARNIIMYGIIGLIVTLFAFAIVNFVLSWVNGG